MTNIKEQKELDLNEKIWARIEPVLKTLDEDQIDRLLAIGFDDPVLYAKELLKEAGIKEERMRQEKTSLRNEIEEVRADCKRLETEKHKLEADLKHAKSEVKRKEKELENSEKGLCATILKKMKN